MWFVKKKENKMKQFVFRVKILSQFADVTSNNFRSALETAECSLCRNGVLGDKKHHFWP